MFSSCHLERASNVEIGVECQIFLIVIFLTATEFYNLGHTQGIIKLPQSRSFVVLCTNFRSDFHVGLKNQNKHSTLNSTFDAYPNDMNRT